MAKGFRPLALYVPGAATSFAFPKSLDFEAAAVNRRSQPRGYCDRCQFIATGLPVARASVKVEMSVRLKKEEGWGR
jgi:hypothetical protein